VMEDIVIGFEDQVRQPVVAHLPNILDGVEFWAFGGQQHDCFRGNFDEVKIHCSGIASRHDERWALAFLGAGASTADRAGEITVVAELVRR